MAVGKRTGRLWVRQWGIPGGLLLILLGLCLWAVFAGAGRLNYTWQWERVWPYILARDEGQWVVGNLLYGLGETLKISILSMAFALPCGLVLAAGLRSCWWSLRVPALAFFGLVRNTPLLVQLYVSYFILGPVLDLDRMAVAIGSLVAFHAAYLAPILTSGFDAVPKGQREAAAALGLDPWFCFRKVIFPQAFKIVLPPVTNEAVNLVKNSALLSAVSLFELVTEGKDIIADTFMSFEIWLTVGLLYLCLTIPGSWIAHRLELRWKRT